MPSTQQLKVEKTLRPILLDQIVLKMKEAGISQGELAKRLKVSRPNISMLLDGKRAIPLAILLNIVEALGGTVSIEVGINQNIVIYTTEVQDPKEARNE